MGHIDKHDLTIPNQIYAFFYGSRPIGEIRQISYICFLGKDLGNPTCCVFENYIIV